MHARIAAFFRFAGLPAARNGIVVSIVVTLGAAGLASELAPGVALGAGKRLSAAVRPSAAAPGRFARPRVCPYEVFSRRLQRCTRDTRGAALSTNRFVCSANVIANRPATVRYRISYDGVPMTGWRPTAVSPGTSPVWVAYNLGTDLPLPTGAWTCTLVLGSARVTIPFRTVGQTGDVVNFAVCAGKNTIGTYEDGICRTDESVSELPTTGVIVCSLIVTHQVGSVPTIDFLDSTGVVIFSFTGKRITEALWPVWAWRIAETTFAPGAYACRVSLNGQVVATRKFTVAG